MGNYAKYMILLARTNPDAERKYDGLSFFLSPMQVPGIDPKPIRKLTGEYGFTQTYFNDARIPASCLMGEEGQGWLLAMKTLQYERGAETGAAGGLSFIRIALEDMIESLQGIKRGGEPVLHDPVVRDELMQLVIEDKALSVGDKRAAISALTHDYRGSLPLSNKYRWTEYARRMRQAAVRLQGANGSLYVKDAQAVGGGFWQRAYLQSFSATIGGGTSQVQANIIAEHVLGLPK
jgi:alkylation response protein AidB-like acyl-CoA dehydrogenase